MAYKVFLSHAGDDEPLAEAISEGLEKLNITVYMYERDEAAGADLPQKLVENIRSSDALVALLTEAAAVSSAVGQEIGVAVAAGIRIVPVLDPDVDFAKFTMLQGLEFLPLDRDEPSATILNLTARIANLRHENVVDLIKVGLAIGVMIWFARNSEGA